MQLGAVSYAAPTHRECPGCGATRFDDTLLIDGLSTHTRRACGLILSSIVRRTPKVGQYANVDLRAYLRSVGAVRDEQSTAILSCAHNPRAARRFVRAYRCFARV